MGILIEKVVKQGIVHELGQGYLQIGGAFQFPFQGVDGSGVPGPAPACNSVVYIVEQHIAQSFFSFLAPIQHEAKTSVYYFSPSDAPSVVN